MVKMDIDTGHIHVSHNIETLEQLATELLYGIDMIISDKVLSQSGLSPRKRIPCLGYA